MENAYEREVELHLWERQKDTNNSMLNVVVDIKEKRENFGVPLKADNRINKYNISITSIKQQRGVKR